MYALATALQVLEHFKGQIQLNIVMAEILYKVEQELWGARRECHATARFFFSYLLPPAALKTSVSGCVTTSEHDRGCADAR